MQVAIEQGLAVLNWYENRPEEEIPPEYLWDDSEGLEEWWQRVKERKDFASSAGVTPADVEDDDLVANEFAEMFKGG